MRYAHQRPCQVGRILAFWVFSLVFTGMPARAQELELAYDKIMAPLRGREQPAELRWQAIQDLAQLGEPVIPLIKNEWGINRERSRIVIFTLAKINSPTSKQLLFNLLQKEKDTELATALLLVARTLQDAKVDEHCFHVLQRKSNDLVLRTTAAFALQGKPGLAYDELEKLLQPDHEALTGALAILLGESKQEEYHILLKQLLDKAKHPVLRAGIFFGLSEFPKAIELIDLKKDLPAEDLLLACMAALNLDHVPKPQVWEEWSNFFPTAPNLLRQAFVFGLTRNSMDDATQVFFEELSRTERTIEVRQEMLRRALYLKDPDLIWKMRTNRAGERLPGWGLAIAYLALHGTQFVRTGNDEEYRQNLLQWAQDADEPSPEGIIYLFAVTSSPEHVAQLEALENQNPHLVPAIRIAKKIMRGELDPRTLRSEIEKDLYQMQLLGEPSAPWKRLYIAQVLGGGSEYFDDYVPLPSASLRKKGERRVSAAIPAESTFFEDLWFWLFSE